MNETNNNHRAYVPQKPEIIVKNIEFIKYALIFGGILIGAAAYFFADNIAQSKDVSSEMARAIGVALGAVEIVCGFLFGKLAFWPVFNNFEEAMSNCKRVTSIGVAGTLLAVAAYFATAGHPLAVGAGLFFAGMAAFGGFCAYTDREKDKAYRIYLAKQGQTRN